MMLPASCCWQKHQGVKKVKAVNIFFFLQEGFCSQQLTLLWHLEVSKGMHVSNCICIYIVHLIHPELKSWAQQKWSLVSFNFYILTDNSFSYVFANTIATSGRYWVPQCLIKYKLSALIKQYVFFFYMSAVTYQAIKAWEMHVIIYPICNCPTYITWPKPLYMMFLYECCTNKLFFFL